MKWLRSFGLTRSYNPLNFWSGLEYDGERDIWWPKGEMKMGASTRDEDIRYDRSGFGDEAMRHPAATKPIISSSANERQHGGSHYNRSRGLQHWDMVHLTGMGYFNGNASAYVSRWRFKNGPEDLSKAIHYCDKAMELELELGQVDTRTTETEYMETLLHTFAADNELSYEEYVAVRLLALSRYSEAKYVIESMLKRAPTSDENRLGRT